jgi:hypothetical protein
VPGRAGFALCPKAVADRVARESMMESASILGLIISLNLTYLDAVSEER